MTHSVLRAVAVLFAVWAFASPARLLAQQPRLSIRMYDLAAVGLEVRTEAMRTAAAIADEAGVAVRWTDCSRGGADHPCRTVPGVRELVVRLMPAPESGTDKSRGALSVRGLAGSAEQLGFAAIGDTTRAGILATVYYPRVRALARTSGVATGRLLGRAIAHEVGHLLLPGGGHSRNGLMRTPWAYEELLEDRRQDWLFSLIDGRLLRAAASNERGASSLRPSR